MKRVGMWLVLVSFIFLQGAVMPARAETQGAPYGVIINEIQTNGAATGTSDQEFIELKNVANVVVDISGWSLVYTPSSGLLSSNKTLITFATGTSIAAGGLLVIAPSMYLSSDPLKLSYGVTGSALAADNGILALKETTNLFADIVAWGTVIKGTLPLELEPAATPTKGGSIARKIIAGQSIDTNNNFDDFEKQDTPTPGTQPGVELPPEEPEEPSEETPEEPTNEVQQPETPTPPEPTPEPSQSEPEQSTPQTTATILLNELYIDPVSPETDANDEYIELYNPNDFAVDLKNYTVFAGSTFSYKYVFTESVLLQPRSYFVITSSDTVIALSNGGGAAKITAPDDLLLDQTTYQSAKPGEAWAKNESGQWVWTTTATKNETNIITAPLPPVVKAAAVKAAKSTAKKATTAKTTAKPKTTKAKTTKVKAAKNFADEPALIAAPTPVPWWLLAVLLILAVLYIVYEYRFELNNTIYRFKQYRNTRR